MFHCTAMLQRPNPSSHCIFLSPMFFDYAEIFTGSNGNIFKINLNYSDNRCNFLKRDENTTQKVSGTQNSASNSTAKSTEIE